MTASKPRIDGQQASWSKVAGQLYVQRIDQALAVAASPGACKQRSQRMSLDRSHGKLSERRGDRRFPHFPGTAHAPQSGEHLRVKVSWSMQSMTAHPLARHDASCGAEQCLDDH